MRLLLPTLLGLALAACGGGGPAVVRVQAGRAKVGRFVSSAAYEASLDAAIAEERGEWPRAVELLRRARDEDPEGPELGARLGVALCHAGNAQAGFAAIDSALRLDPELERGWTARARCRLLTAKTDADRLAARQDLERALGCDADALEPALMLIELDVQAGALGRARLRAEEAVVLHPRSARALRALAEIAARQGDAKRAVAAALDAAALDDVTGATARANVREAVERSGVASYALALRGSAPPTPSATTEGPCRGLLEAFHTIVARGDEHEIATAAEGARAQCPELDGTITLAEVTATWSPKSAAAVEARALAAPSSAARRFGARMRLRRLSLDELLDEGALPPAEDRETLALQLARSAVRGGSPELAEAALDLAPAEPTVARLCAEHARRKGRDLHDPVRAHACALSRTTLEKQACGG